MCGILGYLSFEENAINKDQFKKALNLQSHRGPDNSDIYEDTHLIFGHRRLSIIDLDSHAKKSF